MAGKEGEMPWKTSHPHESSDDRIGRHVDVEKFDDRGQKDKSAGKMKVSYDETKPTTDGIKKK